MKQLEIRCKLLTNLFTDLQNESSRNGKELIISHFLEKHPKMQKDMEYAFEVLAGKHKLGYTYVVQKETTIASEKYEDFTIRRFFEEVLKIYGSTQDEIKVVGLCTPNNCREFICKLANREFKLGYSNKQNMVTNISPMLAKKYPDAVNERYYYVQEKLDGNRCIARYNYDTNLWEFWSRSGKQLKVNFDMSWALKSHIFDGEIMTYGHAGSRDFNSTSGAINGKYTDKSKLHYYIYDLIMPFATYKNRKEILDGYIKEVSDDCTILKVLDKVLVYKNPEYNYKLDEWLDTIVDKGGEGIMLRDPDGYYECAKRSNGLLKYKKLQTMDLRIIGWNEGKGKYEGCIGSFQCETDDHTVYTNVAGISDEIRQSDPNQFIGKIVEVAYFDTSKSKNNKTLSLRFPRIKRFREDKDDTSIY